MSIVMMAEKEPAVRKRVEKVLIDANHRLLWVSNADDLLEQVEIHEPDVLVLDLVMPKMSGAHVLKELRSRGRNIPILMTAAKNATPASIPDWAVDYLPKPLDPKELLLRITRAIKRAQKILPLSHPELYDSESGRLDAQKIADFLAIPLSQLAEALGSQYATVHKTPASVPLQKSLRPIKRAIELVSQITRTPAEARMWMNNLHPDLGERSPLEVIQAGRTEALVTILENALAGLPS